MLDLTLTDAQQRTTELSRCLPTCQWPHEKGPFKRKLACVQEREDTRPTDAYRGPVELTLNIGSNAGIRQHMRFFVSKYRVWLIGRAISVKPDRCIVEITMCHKQDRLPGKGWTITTQDPGQKPRSPYRL